MVSHKTRGARTRRYTYAERTVTAISDIRKRNPRSSIHFKTLKAQIKRNSEAQGDQLGPHWYTRVNTACKELSTRGLLDAQRPPGHIALTPDGKRLIEKIRQSVDLPDGHEHTPDCRENLGRKIIHALPDSRAKNLRRPSVATVDENGTARNPPSRMTKAELLAANMKLKIEYEALKSESARKVAELNAELESRDDELLEYRDKFSGFDDSEWKSGDMTLVQDDSDELIGATSVEKAQDSRTDKVIPIEVDELQTPPHSDDCYEPLNNADVASHVLPQRPIMLNVNPLVRTKSGSFISSISKQPTPAPSDAGADSVPGSPTNEFMDIERAVDANRVEVGRGMNMMDFDFFGDGISEDSDVSFDLDTTLIDDGVVSCDNLKTPSAARAGLQMHTPMSSPSPPRLLRRNASEADAARKRIERLVDERQEDRIEYEKKLTTKDLALKERDDKIRQLQAQLSDHSRLEEDLRVLREQYNVTEGQRKALENDKMELQWTVDNLKNQLHDKSAEVLDVQVLLEQKDQETQDHASAVAVEKAYSSDLAEQLERVQQELQTSELSRQTLQSQLDKALAETKAVRNTLQGVTQDLQTSLGDAQSREAAFIQDVEQSRQECEHLRAELQVSIEQAEEARTELAGIQAKLYDEMLDKGRLELDLAAAREAHGELGRTVNALRSELDDAQKESRDAINVLRQETDAQNTQLMQVLREAEEEIADLKEGYAKLKRVQMAELEEMDQRVSKKRKRASIPTLRPASTLDTGINFDTIAL